MKNGFWENLKKPIFCLAPMADVTDAAFRFIISKYSNIEHITYTEFVSADGLVRAPEEGRKKLLKDLEYSEIERPIVAQFFSGKPEMLEKASRLAFDLGFDGVDINMGCPDKSVEKQGAGASLIKNPNLAVEIILAAKSGASGIPVSVKTRLGYNKNELESWLPNLLSAEPSAVAMHARTRKEMSKVEAHWGEIKKAVQIRDALGSSSLIIGNGDVKNLDHAREMYEFSKSDGVMLGRAVFGNPFIFSDRIHTERQRLEVLVFHSFLFEEKFKGIKNFSIMKKHFKSYLSFVKDSKTLKDSLMNTNSASEVKSLVDKFLMLYN